MFAHLGNVLAQSRSLGDHGEIDITNCPTHLIQLLDYGAQQDSAVRITEGRIGIGKMPADITEARGTQERITERMEHHIAVGVRDQSALAGI